ERRTPTVHDLPPSVVEAFTRPEDSPARRRSFQLQVECEDSVHRVQRERMSRRPREKRKAGSLECVSPGKTHSRVCRLQWSEGGECPSLVAPHGLHHVEGAV